MLNLEDPKTFSEKLQWRKVYDRNPLFPVLLDKVRMPEWARSVLPASDHRYLPEFLQIADDASQIDFAALPADLALKCNHASGWNIFLRDGEAFDEDQVRRHLNRWLARKYGKTSKLHETGYLGIPPRIGVQQLLLDRDGSIADDVRFHVFGDQFAFGHIASIDRAFGRRVTYFDADFQTLPVKSDRPVHESPKAKPIGFEEMLRIACSLGRHLDYVRVDFLSAEDRFFLNEMTLYHTSGLSPLIPRTFEYHLGDMWQLPQRGPRSWSGTRRL